jgi:hypothetical protein
MAGGRDGAPVEYMHEIGTGMIPGGRGCTNLSAAIPDRSLAVAAIDGVDPETAAALYPHGAETRSDADASNGG